MCSRNQSAVKIINQIGASWSCGCGISTVSTGIFLTSSAIPQYGMLPLRIRQCELMGFNGSWWDLMGIVHQLLKDKETDVTKKGPHGWCWMMICISSQSVRDLLELCCFRWVIDGHCQVGWCAQLILRNVTYSSNDANCDSPFQLGGEENVPLRPAASACVTSW